MNPHTYKAMEEGEEGEEDKAVSSKTNTLSKTAVTQDDWLTHIIAPAWTQMHTAAAIFSLSSRPLVLMNDPTG